MFIYIQNLTVITLFLGFFSFSVLEGPISTLSGSFYITMHFASWDILFQYGKASEGNRKKD